MSPQDFNLASPFSLTCYLSIDHESLPERSKWLWRFISLKQHKENAEFDASRLEDVESVVSFLHEVQQDTKKSGRHEVMVNVSEKILKLVLWHQYWYRWGFSAKEASLHQNSSKWYRFFSAHDNPLRLFSVELNASVPIGWIILICGQTLR